MNRADCTSIQKLMSPFIDCMVTAAEAEHVESHLTGCEPCQRQMQAYISVRNLVARIEAPPLPEDMILETRVRLSQARNSNFLVRLENRLQNIFKPIVVPVLLGASLTMLLFGVLLGSLTSASTVLAEDHFDGQPLSPLFQPVHNDDPNWIRIARMSSNDRQALDEPLTIETHVGKEGRVIDYQILHGPQNPEVNGWIRQVLSLAQFSPATAFGKPVESRIILSFVAVRN
jgi:putative zinc finger protein